MRAGDSETAQAGVRMLMNGTTALKYGREGKPHATDFRLTEDGMTLTWKGKRSSVVGKLAAAKESKSVELRFVAHFLVGRESAVFKRFQDGFHKATALGDNWSNEVVEDSVQASSKSGGSIQRLDRVRDIRVSVTLKEEPPAEVAPARTQWAERALEVRPIPSKVRWSELDSESESEA